MTVPTSEFVRPVAILELVAQGPVRRTIQANEAERQALALRFGLEALDGLWATFDLIEVEGGAAVTGEIRADVVQSCVVSLEPVSSHFKVDVDVVFLPDVASSEPDDGEDGEVSDADPPERLPEDGMVDLGELAAQYLALALDPYPRRPDAVLPGNTAVGEAPAGPFAALASLKSKVKDG